MGRICRHFTQNEIDFIESNPLMKSTEIAEKLNRSYKSIYSKRKELTPDFKRYRIRNRKEEKGNFFNVMNFCKSKGLTVQQAIRHYGSVREFKKAVKQ